MSGSSEGIGPALERILADIRADLDAKHRAREEALAAARQVIQHSANSIRAAHRQEFGQAREWLAVAREKTQDAQEALAAFPDIYHAGFLHDAAKEYAEAALTLALVTDQPIPHPQELGVEHAAYLNGLAEAAGELRRYALDSLRGGDLERAEALLRAMDEIYAVLVTVDYPDALTRGLRRSTDMVRGVTERTRGDLTTAARQQQLQTELQALQRRLDRDHDDGRPDS
ncbi:MAG: haloacid dehalogenase [Dehalococcoidia bacterium]